MLVFHEQRRHHLIRHRRAEQQAEVTKLGVPAILGGIAGETVVRRDDQVVAFTGDGGDPTLRRLGQRLDEGRARTHAHAVVAEGQVRRLRALVRGRDGHQPTHATPAVSPRRLRRLTVIPCHDLPGEQAAHRVGHDIDLLGAGCHQGAVDRV